MKNKSIITLISALLFLCSCADTSYSSQKDIESIGITTKTTNPVTTEAETTDLPDIPKPDYNSIECDFFKSVKEENNIFADDGTLLAPIEVEYPQVLTDNELVNKKINNTYIEFRDLILNGDTPIFPTKKMNEIYKEYDTIWRGISCDSKLKYFDDKYISFYDYHMAMANPAPHPIQVATTHTFSLETGNILTIDDIFNSDFNNFAENYIINDLENFNKQHNGTILNGNYKNKITEKLNNNEDWFLSEEGFVLSFDPYEISCYSVGFLGPTIPWNEVSNYLID